MANVWETIKKREMISSERKGLQALRVFEAQPWIGRLMVETYHPSRSQSLPFRGGRSHRGDRIKERGGNAASVCTLLWYDSNVRY